MRCTAPLWRDAIRYHAVAGARERSGTRLGDWFATRLNVGHQRYVLATSRKTLLTLVVPARDLASLPERMASALERLLAHLDVDARTRRAEIGAMAEARVARTDSRSVLGSMSHLAERAHAELCELPHRPGRSLDHVNVWLANEPCGALDHGTPADAALRLLTPGRRSVR
jgi:hypothetical protein